jgi:hypothetical protein
MAECCVQEARSWDGEAEDRSWLDLLRGDARLTELIKKVGLP